MVMVPDPVAKPLWRVLEPARIEPRVIFVEWLVQVLGPAEWNMPELKGE